MMRGWRDLDDASRRTNAAVAEAEQTGAPIGDLDALARRLGGLFAGLDRELAMLAREPDDVVINRVLPEVGRRCQEALALAGQLRQSVGASLGFGSAQDLDELGESVDISTRAMREAMDELTRRSPGRGLGRP